MENDWTRTLAAVIYPAQCDAMGHLTVKEYMGLFDQAEWHCFLWLGFDPDWISTKRIGWADVNHVVNYHSELKAGALVGAESRVVKLGTKSLTTEHRLLNASSGELSAQLQAISVQYDLAQRASIPLHEDIRREASAKLHHGR